MPPAKKRPSGRSRAKPKAPDPSPVGGNEQAAQEFVDSLRREGQMDTKAEAVAAAALTLARSLDQGAGMATAAVAKAYLEAIRELQSEDRRGSDDDAWLGALPAAVRDTPKS